eukprot:TRINITY_DN28492_c0_g1_i1.p1 TRINITY_DN28492_c0_g1~~TRINITY_DN28492_c0_g1_i1.p1  ORF type:complete len:122 (-),score=15.24 TRINITY_DN28492_c0_g1_i1:124-489(-)
MTRRVLIQHHGLSMAKSCALDRGATFKQDWRQGLGSFRSTCFCLRSTALLFCATLSFRYVHATITPIHEKQTCQVDVARCGSHIQANNCVWADPWLKQPLPGKAPASQLPLATVAQLMRIS